MSKKSKIYQLKVADHLNIYFNKESYSIPFIISNESLYICDIGTNVGIFSRACIKNKGN